MSVHTCSIVYIILPNVPMYLALATFICFSIEMFRDSCCIHSLVDI